MRKNKQNKQNKQKRPLTLNSETLRVLTGGEVRDDGGHNPAPEETMIYSLPPICP